MAQLLTMPRYGANMEEGLLAAWSVSEGDAVTEGQVLCEIEIEKLTNEMESPGEGVIRKIYCEEGETLPCGAPIAILAGADEDISGLEAEAAAGGAEVGSSGSEPSVEAPVSGSVPVPGAQPAAAPAQPAVASSGTGFPGEVPGIRITPKALKLAEEMGVDYRGIKGTGILNAITREDIRACANAGTGAVPAATPAPAAAPQASPAPAASKAAGPGAAMNTVRKVTARRMMESMQGSAQTSITMDVDVTELAAAYGTVKADYAAEGVKLSYTAILIKTMAGAMVNHPIVRTVMAGTDAIRTLEEIDISVAVDADYGLTVPVLRGVDKKPLKTVCADLSGIASRAKAGTLAPGEMDGGAATISNVGMLNVKYFTPILNAPQSIILGVGTMIPTPVVKDGGIHIRTILSLSLTYDHRIVDGAPAARFLNEVRETLESAAPLKGEA